MLGYWMLEEKEASLSWRKLCAEETLCRVRVQDFLRYRFMFFMRVLDRRWKDAVFFM